MRRRTLVAIGVVLVAGLTVPIASADDVVSVYPATDPPQWNGPSICAPNVYFLSTQGDQAKWSVNGVTAELGGVVSSDADGSKGCEYVVARGADGAVWINRFSGFGYDFNGWVSLGGDATSGPTVARWNFGGRTYVFARGTDGALWANEITDVGPTGWTSLGGSLASDPDAAVGPDGSVFVTALGDDGSVFVNSYNGSAWSGWGSLDGFATSGPSVAFNGTDGWVLARGGDGAIWANHLNGVWGGWSSVGGLVSDQPSGAQGGYAIDVWNDSGNGILFATVGLDGAVWRGTYAPGYTAVFRREVPPPTNP